MNCPPVRLLRKRPMRSNLHLLAIGQFPLSSISFGSISSRSPSSPSLFPFLTYGAGLFSFEGIQGFCVRPSDREESIHRPPFESGALLSPVFRSLGAEIPAMLGLPCSSSVFFHFGEHIFLEPFHSTCYTDRLFDTRSSFKVPHNILKFPDRVGKPKFLTLPQRDLS